MLPNLLPIFLLQAIGWFLPLSLLIALATHTNARREHSVGMKRIIGGGAVVLGTLVASSFWLGITGTPSTTLHLIAHAITIGGLLLIVTGARESFADWLEISRTVRTISATLVVSVFISLFNDVIIFHFDAYLIVDGLLNAVILGLLASLYIVFGGILLRVNRPNARWTATMSILAGAFTLLAIPPHSFVAAGVGAEWIVPPTLLRGGFIFIAGLIALVVYRATGHRMFHDRKAPAPGTFLVSTKLLLQQRIAYLVGVGLIAVGAGGVLISEIIRSSIESVERTYVSDQQRVAQSVALNLEALANEIRLTLQALADEPEVQRIVAPRMRPLVEAQYARWRAIISAFSRVDEKGILRYTYPEHPENLDADLRSQTHVKRFLQERKPLLSGVFTAVQGYDALAMYVPVLSGSGGKANFAGGMAALIRTDAFSTRAFRNVAFLNPNPVAAIDRAGQIIAATDTGLVGKQGTDYLLSSFRQPIQADTLVSAARVVAGAIEPSLLELHLEDPTAPRRWIVTYPVHLAGERLANVLVAVRSADVVDLYSASVKQQVFLWGTFTLILILTMTGIAALTYRWSRFLEAKVTATLETVREREQSLQTILDTEPECVKIVDTEGRLLHMNPAGLQMIEADHLEQVQGKPVFPLLAPEYREAFRELLHSAMRGHGGKLEFEIIGLRGTRRWLETHMVSLPHKEHEPQRVLGITRDVTERHRALQALRESEERYRRLFEESKDAIYVSTPEGKLLDINPAGVEMFGFSSKEEMLQLDIGRDLYVDPAERKNTLALLEERGSVKDLELRLRRRDGQELIVLETATSVRDASGKTVAYRGILRDVTTQRKLEDEIRQAQKMESIGFLAGGIAHDFNNLLGGVLGYASYLKTKMTEDHPFYRHLDTIERSALRAADLTAKLLAFARGGSYDVKPVSLNSIVKETIGILERSIDKTVVIQTVLDEHLPTVEGDPGQLQQVLMNLCVNARDAIPTTGTIVIETSQAVLDEEFARTHLEAKVGRYVVVAVTDTGIGMDKSTLQRIFDPFFTTKEKGKGTGLGLSMVYGIVKAHGGFIRVYSEPGHGSTFRVYLPASAKAVTHQEREEQELKGGTETILIVDDEEHVRTLVSDILRGAGYNVITASDGLEAVETFTKQKNRIDAVILDMIMPRLGGKETYEKLRKIRPDVRVLLSSGYSENGTAREILERGALGFLQKPYRSQELLKKLRHILDTNPRRSV